MPDQSAVREFATVFRARVRETLGATIDAALAEQRRAEDAMTDRWRGSSTAGLSWPSSSFGVTVDRDFFHFNMPSALATDENRSLVEDALAVAGEATGLALDGRRVRGGSNYVIDGRLVPAPEPEPAPGPRF